jgi:hypothetical protein
MIQNGPHQVEGKAKKVGKRKIGKMKRISYSFANSSALLRDGTQKPLLVTPIEIKGRAKVEVIS